MHICPVRMPRSIAQMCINVESTGFQCPLTYARSIWDGMRYDGSTVFTCQNQERACEHKKAESRTARSEKRIGRRHVPIHLPRRISYVRVGWGVTCSLASPLSTKESSFRGPVVAHIPLAF